MMTMFGSAAGLAARAAGGETGREADGQQRGEGLRVAQSAWSDAVHAGEPSEVCQPNKGLNAPGGRRGQGLRQTPEAVLAWGTSRREPETEAMSVDNGRPQPPSESHRSHTISSPYPHQTHTVDKCVITSDVTYCPGAT